MIDVAHARRLRDAGLRWKPASGDRFVIERLLDTDDGPTEGDVFTLSDMTIEAHEHPTGTVLGFNGTTEWALDSVSAGDALWLPREDQLRLLLGRSFVSLSVHRAVGLDDEEIAYEVRTRLPDDSRPADDTIHVSADAADAYALALLSFIESSLDLDG